jgi:hypothetical protein
MKLPGSPSSLYDVRILGLNVPAKADIGCDGAIDHKPECFSDVQVMFFIVFYLVLV